MNNTTKKILLLSTTALILGSLSAPILNTSANDSYVNFPGASPGPALLSPIISFDFGIYAHDTETTDFHHNVLNNHLSSYYVSSESNHYSEYCEVSPTPITFYYQQEKEGVPIYSEYYSWLQINSNSFSFDYLEIDSLIFSFNNTYLDFRIFNDNELPFFKIGFFDFLNIPFEFSLNLDYSYIDSDNSLVSTTYSLNGSTTTSTEIGFTFELLEIGNIPLINITGGNFIVKFIETPYYSVHDNASFVYFDTYFTTKESEVSPGLFYSGLQIPPAFDGIGEFLTSSIGGFLDFELFPGLSLSAIGLILIGLGMLFAILKIFFGG